MELPHDDSDVFLDDMGGGLGQGAAFMQMKPRFEMEESKENVNLVNQKGNLRKAHSPSNVTGVSANSTLKVPVSVI